MKLLPNQQIMADAENRYNEITNWLNSDRNIIAGMRLHTLYSKNARNKMYLATHVALQKKMLPVYLTELANFCKPAEIVIEEKKAEEAKKPSKLTQDTAAKLKKEFPKIEFSELPDELKELTFKRYHLWERSKYFHSMQHKALTDENRFFAAKSCIEAVKENWRIWDELNEWHKFKRILGNHEIFQVKAFERWIAETEKQADKGTKEFMIMRRRARNNLSTLLRKTERTKEQEEKVQEWIYKHDLVSDKINEPKWITKNASIILDEGIAKEQTETTTDEQTAC